MVEPTLGARVVFEGLPHRVTKIEGGRVVFASDLLHERVPRFETMAEVADLRWSDELGAFYLWGRVLGKGRGGVGDDFRSVVIELRDREVLPARAKRRQGQAPAGGEHVNLYCALFCAGVDWSRELAALRKSEPLSDAAKSAVAAYEKRFRAKLADGYAEPGAGDSWEAEG